MTDYFEDDAAFLAQTYLRQPLLIKSGEGVQVKDEKGREYIDCFSGISVNNVGHRHPKVVEAICRQTNELIHTSNIFYTKPQINLARRLYEISGGFQSFLCNSGTEAIEAAIKLVRKYTKKSEIIAAENSFHGRTFGALSATGQDKYKKDFEPLLEGFRFVPYGSIDALREEVSSKTAAVLLEPIQGEGGVIVPPPDYLKEVSKTCRERGVLLVLDEIQTGLGRTGWMFAWQEKGIEPDIFTLAKGLGGGLPIGAMLAKSKIMSAFSRGDHGSTFGGNPVTCAAAVATLDVLVDENLPEKARETGNYMKNKLTELKDRYPYIKEVRGQGLLIGVEFDCSCKILIDRARDKGLLLNSVQDRVLRFAPPLIINKEEVDKVIGIFDEVLSGL